MNQKHFAAIAQAIAKINDRKARTIAAQTLVDVCIDFNPRFNLALFLSACGVAR